MFNTENFIANSFVLVEGQPPSHHFYIIKSGTIKISSEVKIAAETTSSNSILKPGDFFGVISCMSSHAQTETAMALENVSLISVKRNDFGLLIQKNPIVAMKIIRFFSSQLRDFNTAITNLTFKDNVSPSPSYLFNIGKFYLKQKSYEQAIQVFQKFIKHYPNDHNASSAKSELDAMKAPHINPND